MELVLPTKAAILPKLKTIWRAAFILCRGIISTPAAFACQDNHIPHTNHLYSYGTSAKRGGSPIALPLATPRCR
jgi:hypothetical protein